MRRRRLPLSRPYGWRYWTRRAAWTLLRVMVRGIIVCALFLAMLEVSRWWL